MTQVPFLVRGVPLTRCASCQVVHALEHAAPDTVYVDGYHSGAHGFHLDADREPFASYVRQVDRRRAELVAQLSGGRLLDVGCGSGRFLQAAARVGFSATGLEPVAATAAAARSCGLDVRTGVLGSELPSGWDVVTAFHVLEHVPVVPQALAALRGLLRSGGHLVLEVPNWRSLCRREAGDGWSLLSPGEHITYFSRAALQRALSAAGFVDVRVQAPSWVGPPQDLGQALTDLGVRRFAPALRPVSIRSGGVRRPRRTGWLLLSALERVESRAGLGLTLLATARTP